MIKSYKKIATVNGLEIEFEFNKFAKLANGSVMVSCKGTQVLVTACGASEPREGVDFFPLTVDYIEKFYATGRIAGGFVKRETKPSDLETLTARVIDRPLRPSFPKGYRCDTQILATVVSYDPEVHPAALALVGASAALCVSDLPFNGPIASLRVGMNENDEFVVNPTEEEAKKLDLNIAASPDAVLMVEAGADFLSEEKMIEAIEYAHNAMKPLFELQIEAQKEIGKEKRTVEEVKVNTEVMDKVLGFSSKIEAAVTKKVKQERSKALKEVYSEIKSTLNPDSDSALKADIQSCFDKAKSKIVRDKVLNTDIRMDGRKLDEVRQITCEAGVLRRCHGSSLFQRGETQALGSITFGSEDEGQRMDTITTPNARKNFMLHYNFPPYSVGEARPLRSISRREIGHGALAERALARVVPSLEDFNYTIRLVSEVLESNGSSSMASVCAGTLALLDAGVPISEPISGIAMGLISEGDKFKVLSDILGDEDHLGDMDFKVCGGERGITALQMDIKISGLSKEILTKALHQARKGRMEILNIMTDTISSPNEMNERAPRVISVKIEPDKVRDLIGPGGKMIKKIIADTGCKISVDDDGIVSILSTEPEAGKMAEQMVRDIGTNPEVGAIFMGKVVKIMDFGAFVEIKPGVQGLCHISQLDNQRINHPDDVVKVDEEIMVKLLEIDKLGRLKLSRKEAINHSPVN